MTDAELQKIVKELKQAQAFQNGAWEQVQIAARRYAQMKVFGTYIDDRGHNVSVSFNDQKDQVEGFKLALLSEIERAFAEDTQMGITLSKLLG
jgi:hypothetical protein